MKNDENWKFLHQEDLYDIEEGEEGNQKVTPFTRIYYKDESGLVFTRDYQHGSKMPYEPRHVITTKAEYEAEPNEE